jgi:CubicO group peptidase (beta-lactamase class C family)
VFRTTISSAVTTLFFAFALAIPAQTSARATTATRQALAPDRVGRIDALLQRYVDEERIPGAVVLVLRNGKPVYEKAVGWSDKEAGRRMTSNTIFRIASQTKALTSAAILMLVEEGVVGISEPAWHFIPTFRKTTVALREGNSITTVPAKRAITIHDLLTHTAGISYGTEPHLAKLYEAKGLGPAAGNGWYTADKEEPICETMQRLGTLPFSSQPGEAYVYGYNTDILGCVVEKASGMSLADFIEKRITGPLGMKDTRFFMLAADESRLATVYSGGADGGKYVRSAEGSKGQGAYVKGPRKSYAGGAGLTSTAHDYARFLEMIRNGGQLNGVRILSPRAAKLMTTNQSGTLHSTTGLGFGYGFETVDRYGAKELAGVGAFGWGGAYGTTYQVDPESGTVIVLMMQLMPNATDLHQKFLASVYQALLN